MKKLTDQLTLRCGLTVPGRVAMAPLTNTQSHADGSLSDDEFNWLVGRADGGFRWISTCAAYVSDEGKAWAGQLGIASDDHLPGLRRLATALRERGATGIVQLHHAGAQANLAPEHKLSTVDDPDKNIRGASADDMERVIDGFVAAARRAEAAGFRGVEVHGANGYLFTQFLAPKDNPRTDEYGGDLAARARFLRAAMRAIRAGVSAGFAVGVRLSPVDAWSRRGLILSDGVQVARWMAEDGADFVHLSLGKAAGPAPHELDTGPVAAAVKAGLPDDVPVFAAGGMWTRADVEEALSSGVDVAVLGRAAIAHPDWLRVSADPDWQPTRPPWRPEYLAEVAVGADLVTYLSGFSGMVVGGKPGR